MLYLVNFIRRREGETFIIFLNSIFYGRKVASLLEVLNVNLLFILDQICLFTFVTIVEVKTKET